MAPRRLRSTPAVAVDVARVPAAVVVLAALACALAGSFACTKASPAPPAAVPRTAPRDATATAPATASASPLAPYDATACVAMSPTLIAINGERTGTHMGYQTSTGDWDGDGFDDVVISGGIQPGGDGTCAYLFYGTSLASRLKFSVPVFHNETSRGGLAAAFIGDVDGGGRADIAIGDPYWTNTHGTADPGDDVRYAGRVLVFLGEHAPRAGATLVLADDACPADIVLEYDGAEPAWFGLSITGGNVANTAADPLAAPVPPDQYSDLIVGAPGCDEDDTPQVPGQVFVFLGGPHDPPGRIALAGTCTAAGACAGTQQPARIAASRACFRRWTEDLARDRFGFCVANVGDVGPAGGDGYDDVLVGAPEARLTAFGRTPFVDEYTDGAGTLRRGYAEVWSVAQDRLARLVANPEPGKAVSIIGWSASAAGDFDGDGRRDLIVGAPGYGDPDDGTDAPVMHSGAVYVYSGNASAGFPVLAGPITLATLTNARERTRRGDLFGFSVAGRPGHDLDRDGRDDVLVGVPVANNPRVDGDPCGCKPTGWDLGGRAYIVALSGAAPALRPRALAVYRAEAAKDGFGWSVAIGNVRHPGHTDRLDAVCGAPRNSRDCSKGLEEGELDVFPGESVIAP